MTHVSAVICTRNRPQFIGAAVVSVLANTYPDFDLVVVDQSDNDETGSIVRGLADEHANLRYIHTSIPGVSRARNIGVLESTGELVAFTDDDCVTPTDWMSTIVGVFAADPDADMLYGQVLQPVGVERPGAILPKLEFEKPRRLNLREGYEIYGMTANFAARRAVFETIGGFDEILGPGAPLKSGEDFDFEYRAFRGGVTVLLRPEVQVDHYGFRDAAQWSSTMRLYGLGDSAFYLKHVRCGDLVALGMLLKRLTKLTLREVLSMSGVRRRGSFAAYLKAYLPGARESLRFKIDRHHRVYRWATPSPRMGEDLRVA